MEVPAFNSFEEILAHYRKFLKGKMTSCPTHDGPLEDESKPILSELLKMNKYVLTVDSQPGLEEVSTLDGTYKQRAYVDCFMSKKKYKQVTQLLTANTDLLIFGERYTKPSTNPPKASIPVSIVLTTDPSDATDVIEKIAVESELPMGWLSEDMELILTNTPVEKQRKILVNLYSVRILDPIWGRQKYLFEHMAAALK
jgi:hypothetical protein